MATAAGDYKETMQNRSLSTYFVEENNVVAPISRGFIPKRIRTQEDSYPTKRIRMQTQEDSYPHQRGFVPMSENQAIDNHDINLEIVTYQSILNSFLNGNQLRSKSQNKTNLDRYQVYDEQIYLPVLI